MKGRDAPSPASGVAAGSPQTSIQSAMGEGWGGVALGGEESVLGALVRLHVELIKDLQFHLVLKGLQVSESTKPVKTV